MKPKWVIFISGIFLWNESDRKVLLTLIENESDSLYMSIKRLYKLPTEYTIYSKKESGVMDNWFTIDKIDANTYIISEYRHWEETHCYLLNGNTRSLLIDTGLGISNIYEEVLKLTNRPITAVATHIHWDKIG